MDHTDVPELVTKKERRELKRQERTANQQMFERAKRARKIVSMLSLAAILVGLGVGAVALSINRQKNLPGVFMPSMASNRHINVGEPHEPYSSNPPTSGPHYADTVKAGIYDEEVAEEYLIHNMEHGHVIIWYHCDQLLSMKRIVPDVWAHEGEVLAETSTNASLKRAGEQLRSGCRETVAQLETMVEDEFDSWKVVLTPRQNMERRFSLTAWERIDTFDEFDAERVRRFVTAFRNKGPERTAE